MNYFDHAASSVIYPEVLDTLNQAFKIDFANPSSKHILGYELNEQLISMKLDFLKSLNAKNQDQFVFTSSATEANNMLIKGLVFKNEITALYSKADHPSVVNPLEFRANHEKINLIEILLKADGSIDQDHLISILNENVELVIITHVNSQSGVIQDIEALSAIIKKHSKAHVHIDAVQSFGKIKLKLTNDIDSLSVASHKLGGPKGVAGLFIKKGISVLPLLHGGQQEYGLRSSTVAYPLVKGFHKAMMMSLNDQNTSLLRVSAFQLEIINALKSLIPNAQFYFKNTSPYIISFVIPKYASDIILRHLEMKQVYISSTSACSSKIKGFNSSLMALHVPEKHHKNFLRISMSSLTTKEEVENLIKEFKSVWTTLENLR